MGFILPKTRFAQELMPAEVRGVLSNQIPDYLLPDIKIVEDMPRIGKFQRISQYQLLRIYEEERELGKTSCHFVSSFKYFHEFMSCNTLLSFQ